MGQWVMHIEGHGIHDNGRPEDAEAMLKVFVDELVKHHEVYNASFAVGTISEVKASE